MRFLFASLVCLLAACPHPQDIDEPQVPPPDATLQTDGSPMQTPRTTISASDFDQYCTRDDECVAVFEGNACDPVRRANAAIRADAMPEYRAALGAYWSCYQPQPFTGPQIGDPAVCVANRCGL